MTETQKTADQIEDQREYDSIQGTKVRHPVTARLSGHLEMPKEAWVKGFHSGKEKPVFDRCPYPAGSRDAWAWSSGRIEGQAARNGYETIRP